MKLSILKNNVSYGYNIIHKSSDLLDLIKSFTDDRKYSELIINETNGGYFFDNSLHLFGYNSLDQFHHILSINQLLLQEYGDIFKGLKSFGEDIFGNQFVFRDRAVYLFNIETGNQEFLANDFSEWLGVLDNNISYLTGQEFESCLEGQLGGRLCPKKPFVIGGEYEKENLYYSAYPDYILSNANIARQIFGLPEGASITFKTVD